MNFSLFTITFLLLTLTLSAQETVKIKSGNSIVSLNDSIRIDEKGKKVLKIYEREVIEFIVPKGVVLETADPKIAAVVSGNMIIGVGKNEDDKSETLLSAKSGNLKFLLSDGENITLIVLPQITFEVTSKPTFLSYKIVKDAFGKGIAENFLVVQVNVKNNHPTKQFLMQEVSVMFDPKQCAAMTEYYQKFSEENCYAEYNNFFKYPTSISPIDRESIMGVANVEKYRSKRDLLFRSMKFIATVGSGLSGFNLLGGDAIKGFSFLGNGFNTATDDALPKIAVEKQGRLERSLPEEVTLVKSQSYKLVNIFVPADRVFTRNTWELYKRSIKKKKNDDATDFRRYIQLFLRSDATGILIENNSEKVSGKGGGATEIINDSKKQ